jgi:hypothetical protein
MTEAKEWQDIRLEYDEVYAQAQSALAQGAFETAAELYEKAADIASELQTEVKDESGKVVTDLGKNTTLSIDLMQKASDAAVAALGRQNNSLVEQQATVKGQIDQTTGAIGTLGNQINTAFSGLDRHQADIMNIGNSLMLMGDQAHVGLSKVSTAFDAMGDGRDFNLNFTGSGSAKLPLSEKIDEMKGKIDVFDSRFSTLSPEVNADFTKFRTGIELASKELDSLADGTATFGGNYLGETGGAGIREYPGVTDETIETQTGKGKVPSYGLGLAEAGQYPGVTDETIETQTGELIGGFSDALEEKLKKPLDSLSNLFTSEIGKGVVPSYGLGSARFAGLAEAGPVAEQLPSATFDMTPLIELLRTEQPPSATFDMTPLIESQELLTQAIRDFSFPETITFNVAVQSNGEEWLRGLTKSLIDQIFVEARVEQFNAFGQEG